MTRTVGQQLLALGLTRPPNTCACGDHVLDHVGFHGPCDECDCGAFDG